MILQDIHIDDVALQQQIQQQWDSAQYADMLTTIDNTDLDTKRLNATVFNNITTELTRLQNQSDPTFKADKIQVSTTPPVSLTNGQIYFELT